MKELKALAKESHKKTYARHGIKGKVLGVPYADLYKLEKKIGIDQKLSEELWATDVHDARVLAAFIADPETIKSSTIEAWIKTADNHLTLSSIVLLAAKAKNPLARMEKWMKKKQEWHAAAGWHLLSVLANKEGGPLDCEICEKYLKVIEQEIDGAQNRVKHEMNGALMAMSACGAGLYKKCVAAAKRIGKVVVDHGDTACKTPSAIPYMEKMAARRAKKKGSKKTTKKKSAKKKVVKK